MTVRRTTFAAALIASITPLTSAQFELQGHSSGARVLSQRELVRSTSAHIGAWRTAAIPAAGGHFASWTETTDSGSQSYFAIHLAGALDAVVRPTSYELHLRRATFDPITGLPALDAVRTAAASRVAIVQYHTQPLIEYSQAIAELGGEVFDFVESHAHIVRMDTAVRASVRALPFVRAIVDYHPELRIDPALLAEFESGAPLAARRYHVQVFRRGLAEQEQVAARVLARGGTVDLLVPQGYRLDATLTPELVLELAAMDEVRFIDAWGAPEDDMNIVRQVGGANALESATGYTGQGVRVEVLDGGCDMTHPDLLGTLPHGSVPVGSHGTCTAGIVKGTGAGNASARGLAPSSQVYAGYYSSYSGGNRYAHTAELVNPSLAYQCVLQSNSWGSPLTTQYDTTSAEMDDIIAINDILILQSQSNAGSTNSRPQAWAKNIVSIGGINHEDTASLADDNWGGASIGPAADSRMKPDLAYFYDAVLCPDVQGGSGYSSGNYYTGFGGTSAATPITAGHCALFFQMWHEGEFGNTPGAGTVFASRPHFTLAKAAMINTAVSWNFSGSSHNLARPKQGFGHANVAELHARRAKTFFVDQTDVVQNLGVVAYNLNVAGGEPDLRVTLVYRDAMGAVSSSQHRKNDLTLSVTAPSGTLYYGNNGLTNGLWSTAGGSPNTKDTVENVFVQLPEAGTWVVRVHGDNINTHPVTNQPASSADFALWVTGITFGPVCPQPIPYCTPKVTSAFTTPLVGWNGSPALAANDFQLTLSSALPNKSAIAFYGLLPHAGSFHDGVLCARPPLVRSNIVQTDSSSYAELSIPIDVAMVGVTRYYQWWFRDPLATFTDGLSNALEVTFCD